MPSASSPICIIGLYGKMLYTDYIGYVSFLMQTDIENLTCQNTELRNIISSHDLQLPDSSTLPLEDAGHGKKLDRSH